MLQTLAVANYRSLLRLTLPLAPLTVVTGPNGSGKSNLYRALRLLAATARDGMVGALAREGGLQSSLWAGPEQISRRMRSGDVPIQGGPRKEVVRLRLGFGGDEFGYAISLGLPAPSRSAFARDPEIKRECIWAGACFRPASLLVDRTGPMVRVRMDSTWQVVAQHLGPCDGLFGHLADPKAAPEVLQLRETMRGWRFYDHFRTDPEAPARHPQLGTRTPVLHDDGRDLAAALQTIVEIGDRDALTESVRDAFPGADLGIATDGDARFSIVFRQDGLLRPLSGAELSDGTLRYLLWLAALLTPRPPSLMVLNEPETSLHPDLLPALARLIIRAAERTQIVVVSHAGTLVDALRPSPLCHLVELAKELGQTRVAGLGELEEPAWTWPDR